MNLPSTFIVDGIVNTAQGQQIGPAKLPRYKVPLRQDR